MTPEPLAAWELFTLWTLTGCGVLGILLSLWHK